MSESKLKNKSKSAFNRASVLLLVFFDIFAVNAAGFLALFMRFELDYFLLVASGFLDTFKTVILFNTLIVVPIFALFRLYNRMWVYAGFEELVKIVISCTLCIVLEQIYFLAFSIHLPRSYPLIKWLLFVAAQSVIRFLSRAVNTFAKTKTENKSRTMLVGAGRGGDVVIREMKSSSHSKNKIVCIIDDDPGKHGRLMGDARVIGGRDKIISGAKKYMIDTIIIAMPSATARERRDIFEICGKTGCQILTVPGIYQLTSGEVSIQKLRKVEIEDLLGRDSIKINLDEIAGYINGKAVLVTGGGGSIGSELCRQIARYEPSLLIIFDIYENNAYAIENELKAAFPALRLEVLIGSVRDAARVNEIFEKYRPDLVYHAAAHKHVPLMEDSPAEAIKNNVFGTLNVAKAADKYSCGKMVLISTDKAVNPTNIMGATKRICEMVIEMLNDVSETDYVAVRFGNVLGSNGSVIPLFRRQIENGGPVTVTHPQVIRYFMTIPEAVSLVLQAGAYAEGGEIFVLDMGEPVKIDDLARNMIRLSGLEPMVDIKIEYVGLRPGEKLFEELLLNSEDIEKTANDLIFIGHPEKISHARLTENLKKLENAQNLTDEQLRAVIHETVKEFNDAAAPHKNRVVNYESPAFGKS